MAQHAHAARISMAEIAELAGVARPVVTNWRRRHADFPEPVARHRSAYLFDADQVVDWLVATGRGERAALAPDLPLYALAPLAADSATAGSSLAPPDLVAALTALVCLRYLDEEPLHAPDDPAWSTVARLRERAAAADPDDLLLRSEIEALGTAHGALAAVVDALVEAAWTAARAYERVLAFRGRFGADALSADACAPEAAALVAGLSGVREHADRYGVVCVADPAAGCGDLLLPVLDAVGEEAEVSVVAAEADPWLCRVLRRRLAVRGFGTGDGTGDGAREAVVHVPQAPQEALADADVLVTRMPYQAGEQRRRGGARPDESPLRWVERLAGELTPGRTAVVCGPADLLVGALPPHHRATRPRLRLLREGLVEAVVHLPGGLVPYRPAYQPGLWVLRRADDPRWGERVLLADVSDRELSDTVVEELVTDVTTWRRDGFSPHQRMRAHAVQVAVADLLPPRTPLTARRPPGVREAVAPEEILARVFDLEVALAAPPAADPAADPAEGTAEEDGAPPAVHSGLSVRDGGERPTLRSLGVLAREKTVQLLSGHRLAARHVVPDGQYQVLGVPELTGERRPGERTIDRHVFAASYPRGTLTAAGDVVVSLTPRLLVMRDRDGYAVVEEPARVIRVPSDRWRVLPPAVLAAVLSSLPEVGQPTGRAAGAVRPARRLAEVQVPLLPRGQAEALDALLAAAEARRDRAQREIDRLDELCRLAVTGVAGGTLTMADAPRARPEGEGGGA